MGSRDASSERRDSQILTSDERARADRFHFERDRRMFISCRAELRRLLSQRTGKSPESLVFDHGPQGKPSLPGCEISFNLSHSGQWFACAVSSGGPLGMDIEHIHPLDDMLAMAQHFFAPAEVQRLFAIPESERTYSFFECWTRKEAVIKATGEGVSRPLDSFEVAFGRGIAPALLRLDNQPNPPWPMHSFNPAPDYLAALTSPTAIGDVRTIFLSPRP
jgi:4'-phosphopantetheinyl transferase